MKKRWRIRSAMAFIYTGGTPSPTLAQRAVANLPERPIWAGDSNFVSVISEARVLPEELPRIYRRLRPHF